MRIKLGVFFGGNTVEHEISVITYHQAISSIDEEKYEIVHKKKKKNGAMYTGDDLFELESFKDLDEREQQRLIIRQKAGESPYKFISKSDSPALAETIFDNPENNVIIEYNKY